MTTIEYGTAIDYRIRNESQIKTVAFYGDNHGDAAQTYLREHELLKVADYHVFRPIFREIER